MLKLKKNLYIEDYELEELCKWIDNFYGYGNYFIRNENKTIIWDADRSYQDLVDKKDSNWKIIKDGDQAFLFNKFKEGMDLLLEPSGDILSLLDIVETFNYDTYQHDKKKCVKINY